MMEVATLVGAATTVAVVIVVVAAALAAVAAQVVVAVVAEIECAMRLTKYGGYYWVDPEDTNERNALDGLVGEKVNVERWDAPIKRLIARLNERPEFVLFAQGYKQGMNFVRRNRGDEEL